MVPSTGFVMPHYTANSPFLLIFVHVPREEVQMKGHGLNRLQTHGEMPKVELRERKTTSRPARASGHRRPGIGRRWAPVARKSGRWGTG